MSAIAEAFKKSGIEAERISFMSACDDLARLALNQAKTPEGAAQAWINGAAGRSFREGPLIAFLRFVAGQRTTATQVPRASDEMGPADAATQPCPAGDDEIGQAARGTHGHGAGGEIGQSTSATHEGAAEAAGRSPRARLDAMMDEAIAASGGRRSEAIRRFNDALVASHDFAILWNLLVPDQKMAAIHSLYSARLNAQKPKASLAMKPTGALPPSPLSSNTLASRGLQPTTGLPSPTGAGLKPIVAMSAEPQSGRYSKERVKARLESAASRFAERTEEFLDCTLTELENRVVKDRKELRYKQLLIDRVARSSFAEKNPVIRDVIDPEEAARLRELAQQDAAA